MAGMNPDIRHVEVQGVSLDVDVARFTDERFQYLVGKVTKLKKQYKRTPEGETDEIKRIGSEMMVCYTRMIDVLFGDEAYEIMDELAGDRVLTHERWDSFVTEVMEAVGSKN